MVVHGETVNRRPRRFRVRAGVLALTATLIIAALGGSTWWSGTATVAWAADSGNGSARTNVTFDVVPAQPSTTPTTPAPPPSSGGALPVTGGSPDLVALVGLGLMLLLAGGVSVAAIHRRVRHRS
jgi:hypothetical protein